MIDCLGSELWAHVLHRLKGEELLSARLAAPLLDAAWRTHCVAGIKLWPVEQCAGGAAGCLDWARFPRLRRLTLFRWEAASGASAHAAQLQELFLAPPAARGLRVVLALGTQLSSIGPAALALVLLRLPNLRLLDVTVGREPHATAPVAALAGVLAATSPRLQSLVTHQYRLDAAGAALLAQLPGLTYPQIDLDAATDGGAAAWAALQPVRLTSLWINRRGRGAGARRAAAAAADCHAHRRMGRAHSAQLPARHACNFRGHCGSRWGAAGRHSARGGAIGREGPRVGAGLAQLSKPHRPHDAGDSTWECAGPRRIGHARHAAAAPPASVRVHTRGGAGSGAPAVQAAVGPGGAEYTRVGACSRAHTS
ncbi:MAG: hypothetical protein J3K34DRAFT_421498 [Monoraphidium minutum]|nr:MAG: hypothetical protein J3K34DRAFT_421498 [Monoraphidium minutum]